MRASGARTAAQTTCSVRLSLPTLLARRTNTRDNTPAVIHTRIVPGSTVDVKVAAKGFGSENKAKLAMLNPSDDIVDWVVKAVPTMGAGWCPPGMLGIGIGGSAEKAMVMAKEALMDPIDMHELKARGPKNRVEELRIEIYDQVNALGIGAQGLGGLTTVLDVKIHDFPTHAAAQPVAIIPNCAATRHAHFVLDGTGPASLPVPDRAIWPDVQWTPSSTARRINLDTLTRDDILDWKAGDRLLLSGRLLTGRDAAHQRIADLFASGAGLPAGVDFTDRFIYYVGPVEPVREEAVGPAGPTTSTRMDRFTDMMLEKTGLLGMIGKAERGAATIESIKRHKVVYLIAVGGAAYLVSKAIRSSRVVAFADLGMEAIHEFEVATCRSPLPWIRKATPSTTPDPPSGKGASGRFAVRSENYCPSPNVTSTMRSPASASRMPRSSSTVIVDGMRRRARARKSASPDIGALVTSVSSSSMFTRCCASTREMSRMMPG